MENTTTIPFKELYSSSVHGLLLPVDSFSGRIVQSYEEQEVLYTQMSLTTRYVTPSGRRCSIQSKGATLKRYEPHIEIDYTKETLIGLYATTQLFLPKITLINIIEHETHLTLESTLTGHQPTKSHGQPLDELPYYHPVTLISIPKTQREKLTYTIWKKSISTQGKRALDQL